MRPRLIIAVPAMSKLCPPHRQRPLAFDPLEGRQLLSGGLFPAAQPVVGSMSQGRNVGPAWVSVQDGANRGWVSPSPSMVGGISAPLNFAQLRPSDPWGPYSISTGPARPGDADGDATGWNSSPGPAMSSGPGPMESFPMAGWGQSFVLVLSFRAPPPPGGSAPGPANDPADGPGTGVTPATSLASTNSGLPAVGNNPGGLDAGAFAQFVQGLDPSHPPIPAGSPVLTPSMIFYAWHERSGAISPQSLLAAPLDPNSGIIPPGVQGLASLGTSPAAPTFPTVQGPQAASMTTPGPAQSHALVGDSDSPAADRAPSVSLAQLPRADLRSTVDPGRAAQSAGRLVLATTHLEPALPPEGERTPREGPGPDEVTPSPRGADLIAEALPFAGDSLERSLEAFVRQLRAVDVAGIVTQGPTPLVVASLTVAGVAASAVVVREVVRRRAGRGNRPRMVDSLGRELALSFPELPRSWSERH